MVKGILFFIVSTVFTFNIQYSESQYLLKNKIYAATNRISFNSLIEGQSDKEYFFKINRSGFFSNSDLSQVFNKQGMDDFVLIGKGVQIELVRRFSTTNEIISAIDNKYPGVELKGEGLFTTFQGRKFLVTDVQLVQAGDEKNISIECVLFGGAIGNVTNINYPVQESKQQSDDMADRGFNPNKIKLPPDNEGVYLRNVHLNLGEMVYQKNGITIVTKVKIKRKLEDNLYLVENISSGKTLRVSLRDSKVKNKSGEWNEI